MNKGDLVDGMRQFMNGLILTETGVNARLSAEVISKSLDAILGTVKDRAAAAEDTFVEGFGLFYVVVHKARKRRVPRRRMSDGTMKYWGLESFPEKARVRWRPHKQVLEVVN